jgi:aspartyl-tRNA(Asn)/glutamyl-tRNA(Gln) amidotransferase subunit C
MLASPVVAQKLTREDVTRIADLAHLELSDAEISTFTGQLGAILDWAAVVQQVDTTGVPPTAHPFAASAAWREDRAAPSLDRAEVLSEAPDASGDTGLFTVPKVL